ncbi:MAG: VTT domain-containing protein [Asticcacaulis sp.]|nr:VTT domain-containing protein [Asticcacaulis sp.]
MRREGAFYVVALRLLPVFPFSLTNITLGMTAMRTTTFYVVSQLSTLPAIAIYANAGTRLAEVKSMSDVVTPELISALCLLGLLPWIAKAAFKLIRPAGNKDSE